MILTSLWEEMESIQPHCQSKTTPGLLSEHASVRCTRWPAQVRFGLPPQSTRVRFGLPPQTAQVRFGLSPQSAMSALPNFFGAFLALPVSMSFLE